MGYFASLIAICAVAGVVCVFVPDSDGAAGRLVRLVASLAVLSVALSPLSTAKEHVAALFDEIGRGAEAIFEDGASDGASDLAGRELSFAVASAVCDKFALPPERVKVAVSYDGEDGVPERLVSVRVSIVAGDGTPDPGEVGEYVRELTGAKAEAVVLAPG